MKPEKTLWVGLGEVLWDVIDGEAHFGGAPANFACHAAAFGRNSAVASRVGGDELGRRAIKILSEKQVQTRFLQVCEAKPTGQVDVKIGKAGQPNYHIQSDVAWDHIQWETTIEQLARTCDVVSFGTLSQRSLKSRKTIRRFLSATKPDCFRVLDINLRPPYYDNEVIVESLKMSNILKLNEDELAIVCRASSIVSSDMNSFFEELSNRFDLQLIALTRGEKGSVLYSNGICCEYSLSERIDVIDTIGAGDAFTAATIWGLESGHSLNQINRMANKVAQFVCKQTGATPRLTKELLNKIESPP